MSESGPDASLDSTDDRLIDACAVAKLHVEGLTGKQIGIKLGLPARIVFQLLNFARERKWLRETLHFPPQLEDDIDRRVFYVGAPEEPPFSALLQRLHPHFRAVRIFHTPKNADFDERLPTFARCLGTRVAELLTKDVHTVGVAWGRTVFLVVRAVCEQRVWKERETPVKIVATTGEMVSMADGRPELSSTELAVALADAIERGCAKVLALRGVPAFIDMDLSGNEVEAILKLTRRYATYREAFGDGRKPSGKGLCERLDALITSVGNEAQPHKLFTLELHEHGVPMEELKELTCGDIGGVLIPKQGLSAPQKRRLANIMSRWTGISLDAYFANAERAMRTHAPGVCCFAIHRNKHAVVLEAVRRGLINELFIDEDLALAIWEDIRKPPGS